MIQYGVMTRTEAAAAGLTRYNTGRPCRQGHTADRYTSTGSCLDCLKRHNAEFAATVRAAKLPVDRGSRLFSYRLHPDDHAAALAYCQGLDLQRGRMPAAAQAAAANPATPAATVTLPPWLQAVRAGQPAVIPGAAPATEPHVPAEFARHTLSDKR